ncbi:alpha/beta hydrolase [Rugosimonospora africana]|uniref:Esterase n=1 Tax=Rugosimonospora africana TaxID=556532 RepID=A0A8J3VVG5_9ACTN|nr:alpha/beta hydrolase-fold protein [Rugosimonospora africana]GIH20637.1 hypothetical protein Raf01_88090 [Rugosimonospora africana]
MRTGTTISTEVPSATLGSPIACTLYLPPGYQHGHDQHGPDQHGPDRYPVLYLLHGRGDSMNSFDRAVTMLDGLIGDGRVPPVIAVAPDAPWSGRAGWYVDSAYTGDIGDGDRGHGPGKPMETALVRDLVPAVDAAYRTIATREGRVVGGYSMGGAGALRLALAHQRLFAHALVLSPAVYVPLPPADSNTRAFGAYGSGERVFDEDTYRRLSYPALLPSVDPTLPLHLFIAVGRGDYESGDHAQGDHAQAEHAQVEHPQRPSRHDIGSEHEALYEAVRRIPGIRARARVLPGGHDWSTWLPALAEGLEFLGPLLRAAAHPAGTPGSAATQPASPAVTESVATAPAATAPAATEPAATEPAATERAAAEWAATASNATAGTAAAPTVAAPNAAARTAAAPTAAASTVAAPIEASIPGTSAPPKDNQ